MISNIKYLKIKSNKFEDDKLLFKIDNTNNKLDISFINSIRRNIEENLDGYIIDDILFNENTTIFTNDVIIQRLKMLPYIYSLISKYDLTKLIIKLKIFNEELNPIKITTNDFEFIYDNKIIDNFISYNNILLVSNIQPNDKLEFEFNLKKVLINEFIDNDINHYPSVKYTTQNVYTFENNDELIEKMIKDKNITDLKEITNFKLANIIYKKNKFEKPLTYLYVLESNGIMLCKDTLIKSIKILIAKIKKIIDLCDKDNEYIEISNSYNNPNISIITFINETHTIGNLFSYYFGKNELLEYCSYHIPHPLINKLLVKLTYKDISNNKRSITVNIIKDECAKLISLYEEFMSYF